MEIEVRTPVAAALHDLPSQCEGDAITIFNNKRFNARGNVTTSTSVLKSHVAKDAAKPKETRTVIFNEFVILRIRKENNTTETAPQKALNICRGRMALPVHPRSLHISYQVKIKAL
jgi:hypothetical protein